MLERKSRYTYIFFSCKYKLKKYCAAVCKHVGTVAFL